MSLVDIGQPAAGVFQMACTVPNLSDDVTEEVFTRFYRASLARDGSDPVRPFA